MFPGYWSTGRNTGHTYAEALDGFSADYMSALFLGLLLLSCLFNIGGEGA